MTDYQKEITEACEMIKRHPPGPACMAEVERVLSGEMFSYECDATLRRMEDLFKAYAEYNVDPKAPQIYAALIRENVFMGLTTHELRPMDVEVRNAINELQSCKGQQNKKKPSGPRP